MTVKKLERALEFLEYFGIDTEADFIELNSGGNSVVMNPDTEWQEFIGYSINGVAEAVAKTLKKPTKWID